ncbi:MAG: hypothetical protein JF612_10600, partial [Planctomycetia bacterium]|nr:hypothetical protein [Planctomycetia bacterium]
MTRLPTLRQPSRSTGEGRPPSSALLALLLAAFLGCGARPYVNAHIESVNTEYRQLEDYVYALEAENGRLQQEIDALKTVGIKSATPATPAAPSRSTTPRRPTIVPVRPMQSAPSENPPDLESPRIELPGSSSSPRSTSQRPGLDSHERTAPADTPPTIDVPPLLEIPHSVKPSEPLPAPAGPREILTPTPTNPTSAKPADKKVTHLFLNPLLTTAADFDGQPGDDGLRIVLEPRNAAGQFVSEAGPVSIVVLDPDRQGEAARIARWDFDQSAMRQLLTASSGHEIKVEVPWPASAPTANKLKLFVRFETADGRRLQADREIFVTPPGQTLSRWTPRSIERQASSQSTTTADENVSGSVRSASAEIPVTPG